MSATPEQKVPEQHSPSPWSMRSVDMYNTDGYAGSRHSIFAADGWVCDVHNLEDATLIVASPELLSAAEEVLTLAVEQLSEEQYGRMKSGLDRLDVVVKKARGEG